MHEADPEAINALTKPEVGYEERDLDVPGLIKWTIGFFVGTTICIGLTYVGFLFAVGYPIREDVPLATIPMEPNPLLQNNMTTQVDIINLRRDEQKRKTSHGWIDEEKGVAHIPVDQAIEQMAVRGLGEVGPKRDTPAPTGGTSL